MAWRVSVDDKAQSVVMRRKCIILRIPEHKKGDRRATNETSADIVRVREYGLQCKLHLEKGGENRTSLHHRTKRE